MYFNIIESFTRHLKSPLEVSVPHPLLYFVSNQAHVNTVCWLSTVNTGDGYHEFDLTNIR